jgi:hypothetical protein
MNQKNKIAAAQQMHKYVFGLLGIFVLFVVSFPIACL